MVAPDSCERFVQIRVEARGVSKRRVENRFHMASDKLVGRNRKLAARFSRNTLHSGVEKLTSIDWQLASVPSVRPRTYPRMAGESGTYCFRAGVVGSVKRVSAALIAAMLIRGLTARSPLRCKNCQRSPDPLTSTNRSAIGRLRQAPGRQSVFDRRARQLRSVAWSNLVSCDVSVEVATISKRLCLPRSPCRMPPIFSQVARRPRGDCCRQRSRPSIKGREWCAT